MESTGSIWRFGNCEFDEWRHELRVAGSAVAVETKPLEVLHQLLLHAGEVVTKEELLQSVWPGVAVVDSSLATAISKLRKALAPDDVIVTVSRVGYRLGVPAYRTPGPLPQSSGLHLESGGPVPWRDQWRLVRRLGRSPVSEVWLAEHSTTRDLRVFKFASDADGLRRLKREVTLARLLRQSLGERPEFVSVHEWNFTNHPFHVESEYVGPNLLEWAAQHGGLDGVLLDVRLQLFADVSQAVAAAHALDVLHKDIKPANILVRDAPDGAAHIAVADFGSAGLLAPDRLGALGITNLGFTQTASVDPDSVAGTMLYLAPEVLAGQSPTVQSDVYALGVLLYQLVSADFRRPFAPGWETTVSDPILREDIACAASGDPSRRLKTATELADRVRHLHRRRAQREKRVAAERDALSVGAASGSRRRFIRIGLAATAAVAVLAAGIVGYRELVPAAPRVKTIAILPFQNVASDASVAYLRLALADEVANALSRTRGLAVRPFATTSGYGPDIDLEKVARDLDVDGLVTGRFVRVGEQLHITLEAVDAPRRETVWRDAIDAPAESLTSVQVQIGLRVRGGLAPAFGGVPLDAGTRPSNEQAYALFLRSTSLAFETDPNPAGIAMLEQSVALDATYAPAWVALARRYYVQARYADATGDFMARYESAMRRAMALDANYAAPVAGLIVSRVERGDLVGAYQLANDLVRRRADSADAHFGLSYVLRFAGLLDEAAKHCDTALVLDPHSTTSGLRSCAIVFFMRQDYSQALNYQQLYLGSDWGKAFSLDIATRAGRTAVAQRIGAPRIPQYPSYDMLAACVASKPAREIDTLASAIRPSEDPESNYLSAAHLAYCGHPDEALAMLRSAIQRNYCSYPALESDPLLKSVRSQIMFKAVVDAGRDCQRRFLTQTRQLSR